MRPRHEYRLALVGRCAPEATAPPQGLTLRTVASGDLSQLADLMLDAYRDTIDYAGETPAEAAAEVERYFSADSEHAPLIRQSVLLAAGNTLQCACLVKHWPLRQCPLIAYVVCRPGSKRGGLASFALARTLVLLQRAGHGEVRAVITEGNEPSERLFARAGFRRLVRA